MKTITIKPGIETILDDADFERLSGYSWHVHKNESGQLYAYRCARKEGKRWAWMHRDILNPPKSLMVDHKNTNSLDNRRDNLRICTGSQNNMNRRVDAYVDKTSKFKGVSFDKVRRKWRAQIKLNHITKFIGRFSCEAEAALAYNGCAREMFGEFANVNKL